MTTNPDIVREFQPQSPTARVVNAAGVLLVSSDVASVTRKVFRRGSDPNNTPIHTKVLVVANVIFDTLQTDGYWTRDAIGYNFRDYVPGQIFTQGGEWYSIQYSIELIEPSGGSSGDSRIPLEYEFQLGESLQH